MDILTEEELQRLAATQPRNFDLQPQVAIPMPPQRAQLPARQFSGVTLPSQDERIRETIPGQTSPTISAPGLMTPSQPEPVSPAPVAVPKADPLADKTAKDQAELQRLQKSGSGISQIFRPVDREGNPDPNKHPGFGKKFLGVLAKVGDVAGTALFPTVMAQIPGTEIHHQMLEAQQNHRVGVDLEQQKEAADTAYKNAETQGKLTPATADPTKSLLHETDQGIVLINPVTKEVTPLTVNGQPLTHTPAATHEQNLEQAITAAAQKAVSEGRDPMQDPVVQHLSDVKTSLGKETQPKEPNRDDKAIAIYAKPQAQWTPEDRSYIHGYEEYVNKTKIQPGTARMQVLVSRPTEVADPNNPGETVMLPGNKIAGMAGKTSASVQVPRAMGKYMTSGQGGRTLNAFNTAIHHLDTFEQLADALDNGNTQLWNKAANELSKQTGKPAPVNFQAARAAMAGEIAGAFKNSGATDPEIQSIYSTIESYQSPKQLKGAIGTYRKLLSEKRDALKAQYSTGEQNQPNFGDGQQSSGSGMVQGNGWRGFKLN